MCQIFSLEVVLRIDSLSLNLFHSRIDERVTLQLVLLFKVLQKKFQFRGVPFLQVLVCKTHTINLAQKRKVKN